MDRIRKWRLLLLLPALFLFAGCGRREVTITSVDDFAKPEYRLAVVTDTSAYYAAEQRFPDADLKTYNGIPDGCEAVKAGKADGYTFDRVYLEYYAMNNPDTVVMEDGLGSVDISAAVRLGDTELCEQFNTFVALCKEDGTLADMEKRWLKSTEHKMPDLVPPENPKGTLGILTDPVTEPFTYVGNNGETTGYDIELGIRFAYYLGLDYSIATMSWDALVPALESKRGDIILSEVNAMPERQQNIRFTDAYIKSDAGVLVRAASYPAAGKVASADSLTFAGRVSRAADDLKKSLVSTFITENRWKLILDGIGITMLISVASFVLGSLWGGVLCLMGYAKNRFVRGLSFVYITIMDGIPMLVFLLVLYYIIFRGVDIPPVLVAILCFGLNVGAALAGIFTNGVDSVSRGEREAAAALGFGKLQTFTKIIFPQAAMKVFPLYKSQFVSLVKETSIVGYISIGDLTNAADIIRSRTYDGFFPIITSAVIYFVITYLVITYLSVLERKINPRKRKNAGKGGVLI